MSVGHAEKMRLIKTLALVAGATLAGGATPAAPTMAISNIVIGSVQAYSGKSPFLKGTMTFRVNGTSKSLAAYHNYNAPYARECPELVRRYAAALGFSGFAGKVGISDDASKLPPLGNGQDTYKFFVNNSGGTFVQVSDGATSPPKPGAVISMKLSTLPNLGHTAIVGNYSLSANSSSITIQVFEQNVPLDQFRNVVFTKTGGKWYGTYYNKNVNNAVVGWANPAN